MRGQMHKQIPGLLKVILALTVFIGIPQYAQAYVVNLTTAGTSGSINGANFQQTEPIGTGAGHIEVFVEVGALGCPNQDIIQAYNTTTDDVFDNGHTDQFNRELLLTGVPLVGGYREFLLDINQRANVNPAYLSLDELQIFLSSAPNQGVTSFTDGILNLTNASLIYRLDANLDPDDEDPDNDDNWIWLNYSLNSGQGSGDMFAYIPDDAFTEAYEGGYDYVYLYSKFGEYNGSQYPNTDGGEEWAVRGEVIPEPASLLLLGVGLFGFGATRRKNRSF